jgi:hypothetical protein
MLDTSRWARERLIDNRLDEKYLTVEGSDSVWRGVDTTKLTYASYDLNRGEKGDSYTEHRYSG